MCKNILICISISSAESIAEKNIVTTYPSVSVRELQPADVPDLLNYWFTASDDYLHGLGVDISRMPAKDDFRRMLELQLSVPYEQKKAYALIWLLDNVPVGHSNLNPITFGEHAWMHLHLWSSADHGKGMATQLIRLSLPYYFEKFQLKEIYCEPKALNPAPHRVLEKTGFVFEKEYVTVPGSINFEQPVKRWVLTVDRFKAIHQL